MSCSKRLRMRNWDIMLESHGRLDKTMYGESIVKVCRSRQPSSFSLIFHGSRHIYAIILHYFLELHTTLSEK